jgi:putative two-component system response regulator
MTTDRPYRRALTFEALLAELKIQSGRQFDPELVEAFCRSTAVHSIFSERRRYSMPPMKAGQGGWRLRIAK